MTVSPMASSDVLGDCGGQEEEMQDRPEVVCHTRVQRRGGDSQLSAGMSG